MQDRTPPQQPEFLIVVPLYNAREWIVRCLDSIFQQRSPWPWRCVVIDDASDDGSPEEVQGFLDHVHGRAGSESLFFLRNAERVGALQNIVSGFDYLKASRNPLDVLMVVDGDDWLYGPLVFSAIAQAYQQRHCWMTWGGLVTWPEGRYVPPQPLDLDIVNGSSYRSASWQTSHLRTFMSHLWYSIKDSDLRDSSQSYYSVTWDMALMFPMLEMAGHRALPVDQLLYSYNCSNPISDHVVRREQQYAAELEIRAKPAYPRRFLPELSLKGSVSSADRLTFLLIADQNPAQALLLAQSLSLFYPGCSIALLIDPERSFLGDLSKQNDHLIVIENAFRRGRTDFVEALFSAIRQLAGQLKDNSWFFVLDSDSYPLLPCNQLLARLDSSTCDAFIQYEPIVPGEYERPWQETCYTRYFDTERDWPFGREGIGCFAGSPWMIIGSRALHVLAGYPLADCPIFSHYSALQKRRDDHLLGDMIPEESYIHSLLVNRVDMSVHAGSAIYADWSPGRPRELVEGDLEALREQGWLFAQSFDIFSNHEALAAAQNFILRESLLR